MRWQWRWCWQRRRMQQNERFTSGYLDRTAAKRAAQLAKEELRITIRQREQVRAAVSEMQEGLEALRGNDVIVEALLRLRQNGGP